MLDANEKPIEMEEATSFVDQELETLQSIYISEMEIKKEEKYTSVSIDLHPATADNHAEQYVRMTLKLILNEEYPQAIPEISIKNPRGLSEEKLNSIMQEMTSIAESKTGSSMLFEIIEAAKEHLTNENRPCGECAICLYGFSEDDVFTKTECYHYFHSHCLARYIKNAANFGSDDQASPSDTSDKEILCPMCRLVIHFDGSEELFPPPSAKDDEYVIDKDVVALQKKMADMYQKQLDKGGIIDVEAEKNKYLLEISNAPTRVNVEKSSPNSTLDGTIDGTDNITEAEPSSKPIENICGDNQSVPKNKVSGNKDSHTEYRNKDKFDNRPRNDRYGYNKQSKNYANRGNFYRGNQRYNRYSKPNTQNYNRKGNDRFEAEDLSYRDEQYTDDENSSPQNKPKTAEEYSEDSHDVSPVSESSPGFRSSNPQRRNVKPSFRDSKNYISDRKRSDFRQNSHRGRKYGPNDYENYRYRGNQPRTKNSPLEDDSSNVNDIRKDEVTSDNILESDSNIHENSSESVCEQTSSIALTEKQEDELKYNDKMQESRAKSSSTHNRKNSYRNYDCDSNYPDDNIHSQEPRKETYRRGNPSRGYRNNYNDRQSYRENDYHSQGSRYSQDNSYKRNFKQQSYQGDRYSQEKNSYNYEDRRDYNRNRFNDPSVHDGPNRKFSSDDRYEYRGRENSQGNTSKKPSYKGYHEEQLDDAERNYMEKGTRYNGRNRNNYHYQNRDQNSRGNRNYRYDNYSSYQNNKNSNRRNAPRKFSDNYDNHKGDERTASESQPSPTSYTTEKQFSTTSSEQVSVPKTDVSKSLVSEVPFKETNVPEMKTTASDTTSDAIPHKDVRPPPGFNNPLKKVVYGLQAANPPPGFPRS